MERKQNSVWVWRQLAPALMRVAMALALALVGLPTQAASEPPSVVQVPPVSEKVEQPPAWWYTPDTPVKASEATEPLEQPEWWYVPQDGQELSSQDFTIIDIAVSLPGSQSLNAGAIPLNVKVTADGKTPELIIQVVSEDLPDRAIYADYEKSPDGAIQTLGGFQQARFLGGVGPDNRAEVTFKYEALTAGWLNFTVKVWSEGNLIYGPGKRSIYISPVTPTFTSMNASVSLPGSQSLNAGAIPLNVKVTADGKTPGIIIQVLSEDLPDRAIYAGYEKIPDGAVQTLGGFQQARFLGGVGPDNTAEVTFKYEALTVGWLNFTVKVWSRGNLIYGPRNHSVYVSAVTPTFTNLNIAVSPKWGSQGLNAGAVPLNIKVTADGKTPEIIVQVVSEDLPDRAIYAGYEKIPDGAVQTLGGFQQARFLGGVGPDNTAEITFKYEALTIGWLNFTVQVWSGSNLLYGPEAHWIYIREAGSWTATFPPLIHNFGVASQEHWQITFNVDVSGNPDPQYKLACGSNGTESPVGTFSCLYQEPGEYIAALTASNYVQGVEYSDVATTMVVIVPDTTPPTNPTNLASTSHVTGTWSSDDTVDMTWSGAADAESSVDGYSVLWDNAPTTVPDAVKDLEESVQNATGDPLADGIWYFHVRTVDNASNWASSAAHVGPFRIDTTPPKSSVQSPEYAVGPFSVAWSGSDASSGVASYEVWVRDGVSGTWTQWLTDTTDTSATYTAGVIGHTYYFRSVAHDVTGNVETDLLADGDTHTRIAAYKVEGQVTNNRDQPVFNAMVSVQPAVLNVATTDRVGDYALYLDSSGMYTLMSSRSGFGASPPRYRVAVNGDLSGVGFVLLPEKEAVTNGGWETGDLSGWYSGPGVTPTVEIAAAHTGHYGVSLNATGGMLGFWPYLTQTVSVPATWSQPTLSIMYRVMQGSMGDALLIRVSGTDDSVTHSITLTPGEWTHAWYDLSTFSGQTVTLRFGFQNQTGTQQVYLDEISVGEAIAGVFPIHLPLASRNH